MKAFFWLMLGFTAAATLFEAPAKETIWSGLISILALSWRIVYLLHAIDSVTRDDTEFITKFKLWLAHVMRKKFPVDHYLADHTGRSYRCNLCQTSSPESPSPYTAS